MNVKKILIFWGCLTFHSYNVASACASAIGAEVGDRAVGIELQGKLGSANSYAMDDDGLLILSMAIAHCYKATALPKVTLTDAQRSCVNQVQLKLKYDQQIDFERFVEESLQDDKRRKTMRLLHDACEVNYESMWKRAQLEVRDIPVPDKCIDETRGLTSRAGTRFQEYADEQLKRPEIVSNKEVSGILKDELVHVKKLSELLSQKPVKSGEFRIWTEKLTLLIQNHDYQIVADPNDFRTPGKGKLTSSIEILQGMNVPLPGFVHMACGGKFTQETIDKIKGARWEARALNQKESSANGDSKQGAHR